MATAPAPVQAVLARLREMTGLQALLLDPPVG
jgi:hypothetical protein